MMNRIFSLVIFLSWLTSLTGANAQGTVMVFDLKIRRDTLVASNGIVLTTGSSTNVVFHPSDTLLFLSSIEEGYRTVSVYDMHQTFTITDGKSYSDLAVMPGGKALSLLQKNFDEGFDLMKYPFTTGAGVVIMPSVKFTDYAWVDDNSLVALFPGDPNQLKLLSIRPMKETLIAQNVAEDLDRFYSTPSVTFIHKQSFTFSTIKRIGAKDGKIDVVIDCAPEQTVCTWTPNDILISSDGEKLYSFNPKRDQDWKPVIVEGVPVMKGISSLSVNSTGDKLAITMKTIR